MSKAKKQFIFQNLLVVVAIVLGFQTGIIQVVSR